MRFAIGFASLTSTNVKYDFISRVKNGVRTRQLRRPPHTHTRGQSCFSILRGEQRTLGRNADGLRGLETAREEIRKKSLSRMKRTEINCRSEKDLPLTAILRYAQFESVNLKS